MSGLSIRLRLAAMVAAVAVAMFLLLGGLVWQLGRREHDARLEAVLYVSRTIATAVDAELGKYLAVAQALARSPALEADDLDAFRREAENGLHALPGTWLSMGDTQGRQVVNTLAARGRPLPMFAPQILADEARAFETRQVQFSDVIQGPVAQRPVFGIGIPVFHGRKPAYYLNIVADADVFRRLLDAQRVPRNWLIAIVDPDGHFAARSLDHQYWVGKPVSRYWRAVMHDPGWHDTPSVEGVVYTVTTVVSPLSGWTIGAAVRKDRLEADIRKAILGAILPSLAVVVAVLLLGAWVARQISRPIGRLERSAHDLQDGRPVAVAPTGIPEIDAVLAALGAASRTLLAREGDLRRANLVAETARAKAELAVQAQSRFFAAASHDLRQPFQAMRLFFEVLNQSAENDLRPAVDHLGEAMGAAEELLNSLLDVARLEDGRIKVEWGQVDLGRLVGELASEMAPQARRKGLTLRLAAPPVVVQSDPLLLKRALRNIVDNAIRFTARGGVLIGIRRRGGEVFVEVWDTGIGIAEDQAGLIFEEFYQVHNDARDRREGLGLGLAITLRLCRLLGCRVMVSSRLGKGTVFRLAIPPAARPALALATG